MLDGGVVMGLDLARRFGWAIGEAGTDRPMYGRLDISPAGTAPEHVGAAAIVLFNDFFKVHRPNVLVIEEPELYQNTKTRISTKATMRGLWGLSYLVSAIATRRGIKQIRYCTADEARKTFLGWKGNLKKEQALPKVREACTVQGWTRSDGSPLDDDTAAALAVWAYGCEQVRPGSMLRTLPIFVGGRACRVSSRG